MRWCALPEIVRGTCRKFVCAGIYLSCLYPGLHIGRGAVQQRHQQRHLPSTDSAASHSWRVRAGPGIAQGHLKRCCLLLWDLASAHVDGHFWLTGEALLLRGLVGYCGSGLTPAFAYHAGSQAWVGRVWLRFHTCNLVMPAGAPERCSGPRQTGACRAKLHSVRG